jgi:hypothetical protein
VWARLAKVRIVEYVEPKTIKAKKLGLGLGREPKAGLCCSVVVLGKDGRTRRVAGCCYLGYSCLDGLSKLAV